MTRTDSSNVKILDVGDCTPDLFAIHEAELIENASSCLFVQSAHQLGSETEAVAVVVAGDKSFVRRYDFEAPKGRQVLEEFMWEEPLPPDTALRLTEPFLPLLELDRPFYEMPMGQYLDGGDHVFTLCRPQLREQTRVSIYCVTEYRDQRLNDLLEAGFRLFERTPWQYRCMAGRLPFWLKWWPFSYD